MAREASATGSDRADRLIAVKAGSLRVDTRAWLVNLFLHQHHVDAGDAAYLAVLGDSEVSTHQVIWALRSENSRFEAAGARSADALASRLPSPACTTAQI